MSSSEIKRTDVKKLAVTGLLAAIIFVATSFLKFPAGPGYVNLGDAFIFLAAALLGPYGVIAAMLGSGLADLFAGYFIYIPATVIIKGLMGLVAWAMLRRALNLPKLIACTVIAEIIMVAGYFIFEIPVYGFEVATADILFNLIQAVGGVVIGTVIVWIFKHRNFIK